MAMTTASSGAPLAIYYNRFQIISKGQTRYNIAFIVVNRLNKQAVSLPYFKTITVKNIAYMYVSNIYQNHSTFKSIVSNRRP